MKLIILGAPGSGKGTASTVIRDKYSLAHISTGDIFRANIKNGTELGMEAKKYMDQGLLVPDELTVRILLDRVAQDDCKNGYILDGFPRTIYQAEELDKFLAEQGQKLDAVINFQVGHDTLIQRLTGRRICKNCGAGYHIVGMPPKVEGICDKCGGELEQRKDDTVETAENRIVVYNESTKPLIEYYEKSGALKNFNAEQDHMVVFKEIVEAIG